eukprot:Gb_31342 [translate_table: standard]
MGEAILIKRQRQRQRKCWAADKMFHGFKFVLRVVSRKFNEKVKKRKGGCHGLVKDYEFSFTNPNINVNPPPNINIASCEGSSDYELCAVQRSSCSNEPEELVDTKAEAFINEFHLVPRRFDQTFTNSSKCVRITNMFNGHGNESLNYQGIYLLTNAKSRDKMKSFFAGDELPYVMIMNSGLHDGVYFTNVCLFYGGAKQATKF